MAGQDTAAPNEPDVIRAVVPGVAVGVVVIAALSDPAGWIEFVLLIAAAAAFLLWARWPRLPMLVVTAAVLVPVVGAQLTGRLEPSMFLVSLLAIVIAGWTASTTTLIVAGLSALGSPVVIAALQPGDTFSWGIWMMGIAFPGLIGLVFRRQQELTTQLLAARRQLDDQAVTEERRRIARDVHDLVGHGLAAMLLQVTSARHVLHRDAASADEALRVAEDVGRQSMQELRRTVALLRSDDDDNSVSPPLPGLTAVGSLVDAARAGGLTVEYTASGEHDGVEPGVGLALYRIAQESLVNAARHAPRAHTLVSTSVHDSWVALHVESIGPLSPPAAGRRGYGLQGMRERAEAVGGALHTGPTEGGWLVRCHVPLAGRAVVAGEAPP